jgi:hypothetical protein
VLYRIDPADLGKQLTMLCSFGDTVKVTEDPYQRSRDFYVTMCFGVEVLCRRTEDLLQAAYGVVWHDEPGHCPTWTDAAGCRCDLGS